jgi:hypothetical protein
MKKIDLEYAELFAGAIFVDDTDKIQIQNATGDYIYTLPRGRGVVTTEQSDDLSLAFMCNDYYFVIYGFPDIVTRDAELANLVTWSNASAGGGGGGAVTIADGADVTFGARADTAAISDTAVASYMSLFKRLLGHITTLLGYTKKNGTVTTDYHTIGTTAFMVLPIDLNRNSLVITNGSGAILDIGHDNTVSPTNRTYPQVANNAGANFNDFVPTNEIWIRVRSGSGTVTVAWS